MAYKNYKIRDNWLDIDKYNDVDIQSVDGVIQTVKVNGEDVGGGGGDLPTATIVFNMTNHANNYFAAFSPTTIRDTPGRSYSAFYTSNGVDTSLEVSTPTKTVTVILDRTGQAILNPDVNEIVSLEGSAELYNDTSYIVITGDAVINFTGYPVS